VVWEHGGSATGSSDHYAVRTIYAIAPLNGLGTRQKLVCGLLDVGSAWCSPRLRRSVGVKGREKGLRSFCHGYPFHHPDWSWEVCSWQLKDYIEPRILPFLLHVAIQITIRSSITSAPNGALPLVGYFPAIKGHGGDESTLF
jgi:hypothetical protein